MSLAGVHHVDCGMQCRFRRFRLFGRRINGWEYRLLSLLFAGHASFLLDVTHVDEGDLGNLAAAEEVLKGEGSRGPESLWLKQAGKLGH